MLKKIFKLFEDLNENLDNSVAEISIKRSRISFSFENINILSRKDFDAIDNLCKGLSISEITAFQDMIHVHFTNLSEEIISDDYKDIVLFQLYELIYQLRDILCTCPALEYVMAENYVKVFIDLPNVHVKDAAKVDDLFNSNGMLELNNQRPYILYVKDW